MKIYNPFKLIVVDDDGFGVAKIQEIVEIAFGPVDTMTPIGRGTQNNNLARIVAKDDNSPLRQARGLSPIYEAVFLHDLTKDIEENVKIYMEELEKEKAAREQADKIQKAREKSIAAADARQKAELAVEAARLAEIAAGDAADEVDELATVVEPMEDDDLAGDPEPDEVDKPETDKRKPSSKRKK